MLNAEAVLATCLQDSLWDWWMAQATETVFGGELIWHSSKREKQRLESGNNTSAWLALSARNVKQAAFAFALVSTAFTPVHHDRRASESAISLRQLLSLLFTAPVANIVALFQLIQALDALASALMVLSHHNGKESALSDLLFIDWLHQQYRLFYSFLLWCVNPIPFPPDKMSKCTLAFGKDVTINAWPRINWYIHVK